MNLDATQKAVLISYLQGRLAPGATFKDAMRAALAAGTPTDAAQIKAILSANQRQLFDPTYGAAPAFLPAPKLLHHKT